MDKWILKDNWGGVALLGNPMTNTKYLLYKEKKEESVQSKRDVYNPVRWGEKPLSSQQGSYPVEASLPGIKEIPVIPKTAPVLIHGVRQPSLSM
jgi:hypothetical protein